MEINKGPGRITGRGASDSIVGQRLGSIKQFNEFRRMHGESLFDSMSKKDFSHRRIFEEFAYFLSHDAVKGITKDDSEGQASLMVRTGKQYFSAFINVIAALPDDDMNEDDKDFFKLWPPATKDFPDWTQEIRNGIERAMTINCMKKGIPVVIRCAGIGRDHQVLMMQALLRRGILIVLYCQC